jgi:hypothetical protein
VRLFHCWHHTPQFRGSQDEHLSAMLLRPCLPTVNRARRASAPVLPRDSAEPRCCLRQRRCPHTWHRSAADLGDARACQRSESLGLRAGFCGEREALSYLPRSEIRAGRMSDGADLQFPRRR